MQGVKVQFIELFGKFLACFVALASSAKIVFCKPHPKKSPQTAGSLIWRIREDSNLRPLGS